MTLSLSPRRIILLSVVILAGLGASFWLWPIIDPSATHLLLIDASTMHASGTYSDDRI
jgi:hypothetical protein